MIKDITYKNAYKIIEHHKDEIYSKEFMHSKINIWNNEKFMNDYSEQEKFLNDIFLKICKSNNDRNKVLIKVRVLDAFYSTNLKEGVDDMVTNIVNSNFDFIVKKGDKKLVEKISRVHSNLYVSKECISFASKYCSRYEKTKFPIYDKHVKQMLWLINKATKFYKPFGLTELHNYSYIKYSKVIDAFIEKYNSDKNGKDIINYKIFDRYIWTWAKEIIHRLNNNMV